MTNPITRIGADIGGTFTDVVAVDEHGAFYLAKELTTHTSEADGVVAAIERSGAPRADPEALIAHGHTLVINALLERRGSRTALVTTRGFADVIEMARGSRPEIFNLRYRRDPPLVHRTLRFEVEERTDANGEVAKRPDREELDELVRWLAAARVEAVAVAFLNSYAEPSNERYVARHLEDALAVHVSTSSELSRQWREYERFATAAANAYVATTATRYLDRLVHRLASRDFRGRLIVLDSGGGALTVAAAERRPIRSVESGPVAGVLAARELGRQLELANLVTLDIGGTTAKSCLIEGGHFALTELYWIGGYERGFPVQLRSVDVTEIGAGGGSIAWADEANRLHVGPRSAGSRPGPACYGLGGTEATVTDANLLSGHIDGDRFSNSLTLNADAAADAIARLGSRMGLDARRLALGIIKLANLSMAAAVRRQTLERGRDPREFTLVAFGGAGPMHACEIAADVGIRTVVVPLYPGYFSAIGMLQANLRVDHREILRGSLATLDVGALRRTLEDAAAQLAQELDRGKPQARDALHYSYSLGVRYQGQEHTLLIASPDAGIDVSHDLAAQVRDRFESEYLRRYGHLDDGAQVELVELQLAAELTAHKPTIQAPPRTAQPPGQLRSYFDLRETPVTTDVVERATLRPRERFSGPIIVCEDGATTVIPPGAAGSVDDLGNLVIQVRPPV